MCITILGDNICKTAALTHINDCKSLLKSSRQRYINNYDLCEEIMIQFLVDTLRKLYDESCRRNNIVL